jgi:hypothetical protein
MTHMAPLFRVAMWTARNMAFFSCCAGAACVYLLGRLATPHAPHRTEVLRRHNGLQLLRFLVGTVAVTIVNLATALGTDSFLHIPTDLKGALQSAYRNLTWPFFRCWYHV